MQLRPAQINGIDGMGMAVVSKGHRGLNECKGYFIADQTAALLALINEQHSTFAGAVYDSGRETLLVFTVIVTHVHGNRVDFTATGNPYAGQAEQ